MSREMNENGGVSLFAVAFLVVVLAIGFVLAGAVEAGENPSPDVILDEQGRVIAMRPDPAMVAAPADNAQLQKHSMTVTPTLMNDNLVVRDWTDDPIPMDLPFMPDRVVWEDAENSASPRMAADPNTGTIWVTFTHFNGADDDVFLANSSDMGVTWNWILNTNGAFNERNPSIAISANTINIWYEQDEAGSEQNMNFLMSQDAGVTWGIYVMDWSWTNAPDKERQEDFRNVQASSKKTATWWVAADSYHPALATQTVVFMRTEDEIGWNVWYYITAGWHENVDYQRPDIMANSANDDMNIAWEIWNQTEMGWDIQWNIYDSGMGGVAGWWTPYMDGGNTEMYPEFGIRDDYAYLVWQNGTSPADITAFYSDDGGHSALWILFITRENGYDEHSPSVYVDASFIPHISCWNESRISYLNNTNVLVDPFAIISADDFPGAAADVFRSSDVIEFANSPRIVWTDDRNFTLGIYYTDLGINEVTYTIERSPGIAIGDILVDGAPCPGTCQYKWGVGELHDLEAPVYMDDFPPDARFIFDRWSDLLPRIHQIQVAPSDTTITAYYNPQYNITIETLPDPNLEIVINGTPYTAPQSFWWTLGEVHTLDVTTPQTIDGTSRYAWDSWSDGGGQSHQVTITMVDTYIATFGIEYMVNITTNPTLLDVEVDGVPGASPLSFWWLDGSVHDLYAISPQTISPDEQWAWVDWSDAEAQAHPITVIGPETFTANYIKQYNISFTTSPAGLDVDVDTVVYDTDPQPVGDGPVYFFWDVGSVHTICAPSPQPINPTSRYTWQFWNDMGLICHDITVTGPATYTANFGVQFRIDVNANPLGLDISVDAVDYTAPYTFWCPQGTSATLGAPSPQNQTPTMRYRWDSWSDGGTQSHPIICNMANTYTANFVAQYLVNISTEPQGLLVIVDGMEYTAPYLEFHDVGDTVDLDVIDPQTTGDIQATFDRWSDSQPKFHQVTVTAPSILRIAYFDAEFRITITSTPDVNLRILVDGIDRFTPYPFWCQNNSNVFLSADSPQGPDGAAVTDTRYVFLNWSDGGLQSHMITCTAPGTYIANYVLQYKVTINTIPIGLQVTVDGDPQVHGYAPWFNVSSQHEIGAPSPQPRDATSQYDWRSWSDFLGQNHTIDVTAPATYIATFKLQYKITITTDPPGLQIVADGVTYDTPYVVWWDEATTLPVDVSSPQPVGPGERYEFDSWSDDGMKQHDIMIGASATYTAYMNHQFEVTIASSPVDGIAVTVDGVQYAAPQSFWWNDDGTPHSISAIDIHEVGGGMRYAFDSWSDGGLRTHNIVADSVKTLTAMYTTEYEVTIATNPTGLDIIVDLTTYTAPQKFWWGNGSDHDIDVVTPQNLVPGSSRYAFAFWSDGEAQFHSVTVDSRETITASFDLEYKVTIASSPTGRDITVDLTPYVTPEEFWVVSGGSLDVQGTSPQPGVTGTRYAFNQWSDGPTTFDRTITVTAATTYTVVFITEYEVTITTSPAGMQIIVDSNTLTAPQSFWWADETSYSVDVTSPQAGETGIQYVFSSWSDSGLQAHTITPTGPATYTVAFTTQYYLTVNSDYGTATGQGWHDTGATVNAGITGLTDCADVDAIGTTRQLFNGWTGDATGSSCTQSTAIQMTAPKTATATFKTQYFLTVVSDKGTPTGQGWHDTGTQATFSVTSPVTVDGVEYAFTGWSGDSTDSGKSSEVLMNGPKTVEAKWEESGFLTKFWWIFPIIIIIIIVAILAIWMMKRKKPEEEELPPPEEMEIPPEEEEV